MRLGSIERDQKKHFVLSPSLQSPFVSWERVKTEFKNDKFFQSVSDFDSFLPLSQHLLPALKKVLPALAESEGFECRDDEFIKAFQPLQFRDFYCFEEHVQRGRKSRGLEMIPEWYEFPVFYYSNHLSLLGGNDAVRYPEGSQALDFELEVACVIGKSVINASLEEAQEAILGYCLINDWSARDLQTKEMKLNMGPTKGKDFASSFGPYIITPDEIEHLRSGKGYDIDFRVYWNDEMLVESNWKKISYSFEEMIVRASQNCRLWPGELIASGTMGGGCLMEQNLDREEKKWLKKGDRIRLQWKGGPQISSEIV